MYIAPASSYKNFKDGVEYGLAQRHKESVIFYQENKDKQIKEEDYKNALISIESYIDISLTEDQLINILSFFPFVRVRMAVYGVEGQGNAEDLCDMISSFLMGVQWPTFGDDVDIDDFMALLHQRATEMGYKVVKDEE